MFVQMLETTRVNIHDMKDQLKSWVYDRSLAAFAAGDRDRDAIATVEDMQARVREMRTKFVEMLGGIPEEETPLNVQITDTVYGERFRMEKIVFEPRPGHYVTSHLYIPNGVKEPGATVLFLCGHYEESKNHPEYQTVCQYMAAAGLVVFAFDPPGQGERLSYYSPVAGQPTVKWGIYEHDYVGSQSWVLGDSIARYFLHDAMRAIDYLVTRPEVDPKRIGATGNSGGGLQTAMLMLCDDRIAAGVPATFIMTRASYLPSGQAQDSEQIWLGMSELGFDHEDLLMAMCPRPVLVLAVEYDFFPVEGTREVAERARRYWDMFGKKDGIRLMVDRCRHRYSNAMAEEATRFFVRHLRGETLAEEELRQIAAQVRPLPAAQVNCTPRGQVAATYDDARFVYDENVVRLEQLERERALLPVEQRKERALSWLREKVIAGRQTCDLSPKLDRPYRIDEFLVEGWIWQSQAGLFNHAFLFRCDAAFGADIPITIAVWDGCTGNLQPHFDWIRETCLQGRSVMVLDVSGAGTLTPNSINSFPMLKHYGTIHKLTADLMFLGDSLAAVRVYDTLRAIEMAAWLRGGKRDGLRLYASGRYSVYAELAHALEPQAAELEVEGGLHSFADWMRARHYDPHDRMSLIIPGMLRYFDLPELRGDWGAAT